MINMQSERTEHQRVLKKAQIDTEARAKAMEAEHAKTLRTNLQQAHNDESEKLVRHHDKEIHHQENQYKQHIKEYEAQRRKDLEQAELKEACYQQVKGALLP